MLVVMNPQRVRCSPKGSSSSSLFRDYSPQLYYQSCFLSQSAAVLNCKTKQNCDKPTVHYLSCTKQLADKVRK